MSRARILGICLLAAVAVSLLAAVEASAQLPEYMVCKKAAKAGREFLGHYTSKECGEASEVGSGGEYELEKGLGKKVTFTAKSGKSTLVSAEEPEALECRNTSSSGELTGSKETRDVVLTSSGCQADGSTCTSPGAKSGQVVTNPLAGELGYLAGKGTRAPTVGLRLMQEKSTYSAEFSCEGLQLRVQGPLIAEVQGNVNLVSSESTLAFRQADGKQEFTSFEGGGVLEEVWRWEFNEGTGYEPRGGTPAGLEMSAAVKGEALEIKA